VSLLFEFELVVGGEDFFVVDTPREDSDGDSWFINRT
jgi:hypothetical protein